MKISLQNISKRFGSQPVVDRINLEIQAGEMMLLLGPSGCGKTTVLRMLAGFCQPDEGVLLFGDKSMQGVPPHQRETAMVFQNYALWPHLTVFENVAYGLRVRRCSKEEITRRVEEALTQVHLLDFGGRKPTQLSGGQQQRVALARAFVVRPKLLLFDEPLCNLDPQLRLEMRAEIKRLHALTGITSLYVTHDQEEALSLANRIAVMHRGVIQQIGSPPEVYNRSTTAFVGKFIGEINIFPASTPLAIPYHLPEKHLLGFRPENVRISLTPGGLPALVLQSTYLGSKNEVVLQTVHQELIKAWTAEPLTEGTEVYFSVPKEKIMEFTE